jgi:hypothetical protein
VANPELRQSTIDEVCHYLRAPTKPGAEELKLRLYLQNLLRRRLTPWDENDEPTEQQWEGLDLDLSGAELADFEFLEGTVHRADFTGTRFSGRTDFHGTNFQHSATFSGAVFSGNTSFTGCRFSSTGAEFCGAEFRNTCTFHRATFHGIADFSESYFTKEASFLRTKFEEAVYFRCADFNEGAVFECTHFGDSTYFQDTNFGPMGHFLEAHFKGPAHFHGAAPTESIDLHHVLADSSRNTQTWPEGWTLAFNACLAVVREDEKKEVIGRDGPGTLCGQCRLRNSCRLRFDQEG